jgi:hypothetical protein
MDWELINPSDGPHPYYTIIVGKDIKKSPSKCDNRATGLHTATHRLRFALLLHLLAVLTQENQPGDWGEEETQEKPSPGIPTVDLRPVSAEDPK